MQEGSVIPPQPVAQLWQLIQVVNGRPNERAENQKEEGVNICVDMISQLQEIEGIHGVHIMVFRQDHRVAEIVKRSAIPGDRIPWHPGIKAADKVPHGTRNTREKTASEISKNDRHSN